MTGPLATHLSALGRFRGLRGEKLKHPRGGGVKFHSAVAIALCTLTVATPSHAAQTPSNADPASAEDRAVLHGFAQCVASRRARQARAVLAGDLRDEATERALRQVAIDERTCLMGGRLNFPSLLFAGGMAEVLLRGDAPRGTLAGRVALDPARPPLQARDDMELMSLCVVRAVPAGVEALLSTSVGSAEENAAIAAVSPNVGECLTEGVNARVNRAGLRAMLTLAAYRLVQHNAAAPAASGN